MFLVWQGRSGGETYDVIDGRFAAPRGGRASTDNEDINIAASKKVSKLWLPDIGRAGQR